MPQFDFSAQTETVAAKSRSQVLISVRHPGVAAMRKTVDDPYTVHSSVRSHTNIKITQKIYVYKLNSQELN